MLHSPNDNLNVLRNLHNQVINGFPETPGAIQNMGGMYQSNENRMELNLIAL
jgi:hypothetical protein